MHICTAESVAEASSLPLSSDQKGRVYTLGQTNANQTDLTSTVTHYSADVTFNSTTARSLCRNPGLFAFCLVLWVLAPATAHSTFHISLGNYPAEFVAPLPDGGLLVGGSGGYRGNQDWIRHDPFLLRLDPDGTIRWEQSLRGISFHKLKAAAPIQKGFVLASETQDDNAPLEQRFVLWAADELGRLEQTLYESRGEELSETYQPLSVHASGLILFTTRDRTTAENTLIAVDLRGQLRWKRSLSRHPVSSHAVLADGTVAVLERSYSGRHISGKVVLLDEHGQDSGLLPLPKLPEGEHPPYELRASATGRALEVTFLISIRHPEPGGVVRMENDLRTFRIDKSGVALESWLASDMGESSLSLGVDKKAVYGQTAITRMRHNREGYQLDRFSLEGKLLDSKPLLAAYEEYGLAGIFSLGGNRAAIIGTTSSRPSFPSPARRQRMFFLRTFEFEHGLPEVASGCDGDYSRIHVLQASLVGKFHVRITRESRRPGDDVVYQLGDRIVEPLTCGEPSLLVYEQLLIDVSKSLEEAAVEPFPGPLTLKATSEVDSVRELIESKSKAPSFAIPADQAAAVARFLIQDLWPAATDIRTGENQFSSPNTELGYSDYRLRLGRPELPRGGFDLLRWGESEMKPRPEASIPFLNYAEAIRALNNEYSDHSPAHQKRFKDTLQKFRGLTFSSSQNTLRVTLDRQILYSVDQAKSVVPFVLAEAENEKGAEALSERLENAGIKVTFSEVPQNSERFALLTEVWQDHQALSPTKQAQIERLNLRFYIQPRSHRHHPIGRDYHQIKVAPSHVSQVMDFVAERLLACYEDGQPGRVSGVDALNSSWKQAGEWQVRSEYAQEVGWSLQVQDTEGIRTVDSVYHDQALRFQFDPHNEALFVSASKGSTRPTAWLVNLRTRNVVTISGELLLPPDKANLPTGVGYTARAVNLSPNGRYAAVELTRKVIAGHRPGSTNFTLAPRRLWVAIDSQTGRRIDALKHKPQCDWWNTLEHQGLN